MVIIGYDDGTLVLRDLGDFATDLDDVVAWDQRISAHRAPAIAYAEILRRLHGHVPYQDDARAYQQPELREGHRCRCDHTNEKPSTRGELLSVAVPRAPNWRRKDPSRFRRSLPASARPLC